MVRIEKKKTARFLLWSLGVGVTLLGRFLFLNSMKIMLFAVLASGIHFKSILHAYEAPYYTWIIDEHQVIPHMVFNGLDRILSESARNRNIQLRVAIVRLIPNEPQNEQINQKIIDWKRTDPSFNKAKTVYLIIDLNKNSSHIVLNEERKNTKVQENIIRINEKIIIPHLAEGAFEKALTQGAIALTTVLEEWPAPFTNPQDHYLGLSLKILMGLFMALGAWFGISRYRKKSQL